MTGLHEVLLAQLAGVARALPPSASLTTLLDLAAGLGEVVGWRDADQAPRWSGLTDDCSPFELSLGLGGDEPVVRLLVEAQADPASPASYHAAGQLLTAHLAGAVGAPTDRLDEVADLFTPSDPDAYWSTWHSVEVVDGAPRLRVYLNPAAGGPAGVPGVVAEVCRRLGVPDVTPLLAGTPGLPPTRPVVLTLELTRASRRVGLHLMVPTASSRELEALAALAPGTVRGDATALLEAVVGRPVLDQRSMFATLHVDADGVGAANLAIPFVPHVADDATARTRVEHLAARHHLDPAPYLTALASLAPEPVRTEGVHSFATFVRSRGRPRLSVAFGSRCYAPRHGWLAFDPLRWWPSPVG